LRSYATAQLIGDRSHQCDATATRATADGGRAFAVLDGIGSSDAVRSWTVAKARRLADLTARNMRPHEAITLVQEEIVRDRDLSLGEGYVDGACAVVAVTAPDRQLRVAWIGDCRAYLLHLDGRLAQLTTDHNERAELLAAGRPAPRWSRNIVTRCLGAEIGGEAVEPGWDTLRTVAGMRLLLATDGLYEPIEDAGWSLRELLSEGAPADCAQRLARLAGRLGDAPRDNTSCLIADL
jgi:serine/threonine protein phosphatase PrpC